MPNVIRSLLFAAFASFRTRSPSAIEILVLRHQLGVIQRSAKRPRLTDVDRGLWVLLSRTWARWNDALIIVKPATVIRWHRAGFLRYWAWRSRDKIYGTLFRHRVRDLVIKEVVVAWSAGCSIGTRGGRLEPCCCGVARNRDQRPPAPSRALRVSRGRWRPGRTPPGPWLLAPRRSAAS